MSQLVITKTYRDGETPTQLDLDNIADSLEGFINVTKLGPDNIALNSIDASLVLAPESITTGKIANGAVTTDKIVDASIYTDNIAHGAITTAKIVDDAITTAKIADGAVTSAKIADGAITADKKPIAASGSVGSAFNASNSVYTSNPSTLAVSNVERANVFVMGGNSFSVATTWVSRTGEVIRAYMRSRVRVYKDTSYVANTLDLGRVSRLNATGNPAEVGEISLPSSCIKAIYPSFTALRTDSFTNTAKNDSYQITTGSVPLSFTSAGGLNSRELI